MPLRAVRYAGHLLGNRPGVQDVRAVAISTGNGGHVIRRGRNRRQYPWTISDQTWGRKK